jgi:sortase A
MTLSVLLLLYVAYEAWFTDIQSDRAQEQLADDLRDQWVDPNPPADPGTGDAFAFIHIPRFGEEWTRAVVEGTDPDELDEAPGHFAGSALPGQPGNFALAGHRVGRGSPFLDLDELEKDDAVVIETVDHWFVYRVTSTSIVDPSDVSVLAPTPGGAVDAPATGAYLTLTTCHPKFSSKERLVAHAVLESSVSKADTADAPAALQEG